jgi:hypothetical protein
MIDLIVNDITNSLNDFLFGKLSDMTMLLSFANSTMSFFAAFKRSLLNPGMLKVKVSPLCLKLVIVLPCVRVLSCMPIFYHRFDSRQYLNQIIYKFYFFPLEAASALGRMRNAKARNSKTLAAMQLKNPLLVLAD